MGADAESGALKATILENLGVICGAQGNLEKASQYLERALEEQERWLGSSHKDLVGTLQSLVVVNSKLGNPAKAVAFMQRAGEVEAAARASQEVINVEVAPEMKTADYPKIVEVEG